MTSIITKYLAREILKTSCATLLVLYVILVSNAFGRVLADIADGDVPQQALWPVLFGQAVNLLSLLLPIFLFFGIVFTPLFYVVIRKIEMWFTGEDEPPRRDEVAA